MADPSEIQLPAGSGWERERFCEHCHSNITGEASIKEVYEYCLPCLPELAKDYNHRCMHDFKKASLKCTKCRDKNNGTVEPCIPPPELLRPAASNLQLMAGACRTADYQLAKLYEERNLVSYADKNDINGKIDKAIKHVHEARGWYTKAVNGFEAVRESNKLTTIRAMCKARLEEDEGVNVTKEGSQMKAPAPGQEEGDEGEPAIRDNNGNLTERGLRMLLAKQEKALTEARKTTAALYQVLNSRDTFNTCLIMADGPKSQLRRHGRAVDDLHLDFARVIESMNRLCVHDPRSNVDDDADQDDADQDDADQDDADDDVDDEADEDLFMSD